MGHTQFLMFGATVWDPFFGKLEEEGEGMGPIYDHRKLQENRCKWLADTMLSNYDDVDICTWSRRLHGMHVLGSFPLGKNVRQRTSEKTSSN